MVAISNTAHRVYPDSFEAGSDAKNIQAAINYIAATGGGVVELRRITYEIDETIVLRGGVTLQGQGWTPAPYFAGSMLHLKDPTISTIRVEGNLRLDKCHIKDVAFFQDQPEITSNWAPHDTPAAIFVNIVDDVHIENVMFHNVTRAIHGERAGRLHVERVSGQPLLTGIYMNDCYDVAKFNNVHFWVFWSADPNVLDYMRNNASTILFKRVDNPQLNNIFSWGYRVGLHILNDPGQPTSRLQGSNLQFDASTYGLLVQGDGNTLQISNFVGHSAALGGLPASGSIPAYISGDGNVINVVNGRYEYGQAHGIRVEGNSLMVDIGGIGIDASGGNFIALVGGGQLQQIGFNFT